MPRKKRISGVEIETPLTELEKAVLTYAFFHGLDIGSLWELLNPGRSSTSDVGMRKMRSRMRNNQKYIDYIEQLKVIEQSKLEKAVAKTGVEKVGEVDFTDISQFIAYLNNQANVLEDEKDRQKYLSMLSDLLRFKESGNENNEEIMRFYTGINCPQCNLYLARKKEIGLK